MKTIINKTRQEHVSHALAILLLTSSCGTIVGNPDVNAPTTIIEAAMLRMPGESYSPTQQLSLTQSTYNWTSNVQISSLKIPIKSIALINGDTLTTIYQCATDCQVELLSPALTNLLQDSASTTDATGTYTAVRLSPGDSGNSPWPTSITASFALNGVTYYTNSATTFSTTGPAEPITLTLAGAFSDSQLPQAITLGQESTTLNLKLYFDILHLASAALAQEGLANGFCTTDPQASVTLCLQRPTVVANITDTDTDTAPILEHYEINQAATASLYFHPDGNALGGNFRPLYLPNTPSDGKNQDGIHYWNSGQVMAFSLNADGSYTLRNFADSLEEGSGFATTTFTRADHTGTYTDDQGTTYSYSARKVD